MTFSNLLLAASLVAFTANGTAQAKTRVHHAQPANHEISQHHVWTNWGAAPFAANESEAFSDAKLDKFFADAENGPTKMPHRVALALKAEIQAHPEGQLTDWLNPRSKLLMMEDNKKPMYDVTVAELPVPGIPAARGVDKAAKVRVWAVEDTDGKVYNVVLPYVCWNWSFYIVEDGEKCARIILPTQPETSEHSQDTNIEYQVRGYFDPITLCTGYREVGQTIWHPMPVHCLTGSCFDKPDTKVSNMVKTQTGGWQVRPGATYEVLVSLKNAASKTLVFEWCLGRKKFSEDSCAVMVRFDDYHDGVATIYYDQASVPKPYPYRRLVWTKGCTREMTLDVRQ